MLTYSILAFFLIFLCVLGLGLYPRIVNSTWYATQWFNVTNHRTPLCGPSQRRWAKFCCQVP